MSDAGREATPCPDRDCTGVIRDDGSCTSGYCESRRECGAWAEDQGLIVYCILPLGHDGSHDPGVIDWTMSPPARKATP